MIVFLDEPNDPRLACYADLRWSKKRSPEQDWFVVEGQMCVQRLIESSHELISILVARGKEQEVATWLTTNDASLLVAGRPASIAGWIRISSWGSCLWSSADPQLPGHACDLMIREPRLALAAVGVKEHENLGSMLRTLPHWASRRCFLVRILQIPTRDGRFGSAWRLS